MAKKQLIRLTESDLHRIVENVINEGVWGDIKQGFKDMGGWNGLLKAAYPGLSNMQRQGNENPNVENDVKVVYKRLNKQYREFYERKKAELFQNDDESIKPINKVPLGGFNPNSQEEVDNRNAAKTKLLKTIEKKYELACDVANFCYNNYTDAKSKLRNDAQGWKIYMNFWYEKYQTNFEDSERQKIAYNNAKNDKRFDTNTQGTPSNSNTQQQQAQQQNTQQQ